MTPVEKIYYAFYKEKRKSLYFSQILRLTKLSIGSLQNALKNTKLKKIKTRSNVFYEISSETFEILTFMGFDFKKTNALDENVSVPLLDFTKNITKSIYCLVHFGSTSKNNHRKGSDIDLLVVTEHGEKEITKLAQKISKRSIYPLSVFFCTPEEFESGNDQLIIQAKRTGYPLYGHFYFYEGVLEDGRKDLWSEAL